MNALEWFFIMMGKEPEETRMINTNCRTHGHHASWCTTPQACLSQMHKLSHAKALARLEQVKTSFEIFEAGWNAGCDHLQPPMGPGPAVHESAEAAFRALVEEYER